MSCVKWVISVAIWLCSLTSVAIDKRPNIIFILSDDHRADLMEFSGHPIIKTPHLNAMASNGMYFPNAYPNSPLCTPSRASFFSGKYCERTGAPRIMECASGFLELEKLFPEYLHETGYKTGFIGKWHIGEGRNPDKRGFDYWAGWNWVGGDFNFTIAENGIDVRIDGFTDDYTSALAAKFIKENAKKKKPFFLYLGLKAPHAPYAFPERLTDAFDGIDIPKPDSFDEDYEATGKLGLVGTGISVKTFGGAIPKFGSWEEYSKSYYRAALSIDGSVGTVLDAVKKAGIENDTLVIYTSDHGYHIGEHGLTEKHYSYRHSMKIPMIVQYPALISGGTKSDALVMGMDVGPTVLDICGIPIPREMDGKSWLPVLENGGKGEVHEDIFCALNSAATTKIFRTNLCVENHDYKLIYYPTLDHYELYDTRNDLDEMQNLANDSEYAKTFADMKARLEVKIKDAEWSQMIAGNLPSDVYVLGPVDKRHDHSVRKAIFSTPEIDYKKSITTAGKTYKWKKVKNSGIVNLDGVFENNEGQHGYIAFPVENLQRSTGFLELDMRDNKLPIAGLWRNRVMYVNGIGEQAFDYTHSGLPWFFQYCPPLEPGKNDVVLGFEAQGPDIPLHFPIRTMYMEKNLKFPLYSSPNPVIESGSIPLSFHSRMKDMTRQDNTDGSIRFVTTGRSPFVWSMNHRKYDYAKLNKIRFEYKSETGLPFLRVLFGPELSIEKSSVHIRNIPAATDWTTYTVDLSKAQNYVMSAPFFRFDMGSSAGNTITIRNLKLE